jgi:hypothetical protein
MTQDEKIARTRQLLSAPPRQREEDTCGAHIYTGWHSTEGRPCDCHGVIQEVPKPKRIQPEPNEIGYT